MNGRTANDMGRARRDALIRVLLHPMEDVMKTRLSLVLLIATTLAAATPLGAQAPARMMGAPYHDASRAFIDLMIPHHEMASMMSEHHLSMGKSDAVKTMARKMI